MMMFSNWYRRFGKRLFDLALVVPALLLLAPVMALVALLVRLNLGAPVLFRQQRPGLYGHPFTILKFRTMANTRNSQGRLLSDVDRLTPFGRFLRSTSLDELPALINVLKGNMSLVGPRPLLIRYLDRYTPEQARRHEILPGITGWAQVNGRNTLNWDERLAMDVWYVDNRSMWLDLKIVALTCLRVLSRNGMIEEGDLVDFWGTQGPPPDGLLAYPAEQDETHLLEHARYPQLDSRQD
jgi:lipopolysaccharide/colanic/teichoic acid biosynthesis glycosyltransferase